ncbi:hypothetical protein AB1N83_001044 [Pleurotus pulmonarius]|nr:hypothetical protein EYR36_000028 [Pleurotus pulmonarius]
MPFTNLTSMQHITSSDSAPVFSTRESAPTSAIASIDSVISSVSARIAASNSALASPVETTVVATLVETTVLATLVETTVFATAVETTVLATPAETMALATDVATTTVLATVETTVLAANGISTERSSIKSLIPAVAATVSLVAPEDGTSPTLNSSATTATLWLAYKITLSVAVMICVAAGAMVL